MSDIFISYTSSDRKWAHWIANELRGLGHTPHIHEWEIKSGDDIYAWMEKHHDAADHVLCLVSDAYLKAPYSTLERNAALWQAASKRPGFVLLVAVKPCKLPTLVDHLRRCELFGVSEEEARVRFREFVARREATAPGPFPGQAFAVSNISLRLPPHFMGRDDSLAAIAAALARYQGRVAITALHGLRGVGKTTLAAAYAERHRGDYRATWWIRAQTKSTIRADLVSLGVRLQWIAADEKEESALATVMERLRHEGEGILLIYDNAPDAAALGAHLPHGGAARVLVTSNAHAWRGVAEPVEIRLWPKEIGADYLLARTGRAGERIEALALSEALGGLPLAHEQAAAYCERLEISLADYGARFEAAPVRFLDDTRHAPAEYRDGLTVARTFAIAIDEASKIHSAAEPLIVHAALLAPEPIPLFLFAEARETFGEPLASAMAGDGLHEAVAALRHFALIDREKVVDERDPSIATDCIRLHRLVRQVGAARYEGGAREAAQRTLIEAVAAVYPTTVWRDPHVWPRARRLDAHALALVSGSTVPRGAEEPASHLLDVLASYRQSALMAYADARPLYERALAIREAVLGPEHLMTASSLNNLGRVSGAAGDFAGARLLYERSLAIFDKAGAAEHPDIVTILNNLVFLLRGQGDVVAALPLSERAVAVAEKVLGPEDSETGTSLGNLALLLQDRRDFAKALPLCERALTISEKVRGPEHPHTAAALNNLAFLARAQGDLTGAQPLLERALAIREKVLGPVHPETAVSLHNLSVLFRDMGKLREAEPLLERAIAVAEKALDPQHPVAQRYQSQYARLLLMTDRTSQALQCAQAALATHERVYGPQHAWSKDSARITADALDALGRADEAAALRARYEIVVSGG